MNNSSNRCLILALLRTTTTYTKKGATLGRQQLPLEQMRYFCACDLWSAKHTSFRHSLLWNYQIISCFHIAGYRLKLRFTIQAKTYTHREMHYFILLFVSLVCWFVLVWFGLLAIDWRDFLVKPLLKLSLMSPSKADCSGEELSFLSHSIRW